MEQKYCFEGQLFPADPYLILPVAVCAAIASAMVVQLRAQADPCIGCIFHLVRGVLYGLHCCVGIAVEELNLGWYREVAGGINVAGTGTRA